MKILEFEKIESTQKKAKELIQKLTPWTVIVAKEQTGGYGRKLGEKRDFWYSPKGGLYFTVVLPKLKTEKVPILTVLVAFSVAQFLKENFNFNVFIKLPNDILINGKKICGILIENFILGGKVKGSIAGIGLNTNIEEFPENLKNIATSLRIELGKKVNNKLILKKILKVLKENLEILT
jgi:BirA family biotin operon repressor/biotin-[acetyl-CoA-carboxylase] ligase